MDVFTGATITTAVAPKFSDTLALFQPGGTESAQTLQRLHQKSPHSYISDSSDMNNPDELLNPRRLYYSPIFSVVIFTSGDQSELRLRKWIERQVGVAQFRSSITYIPSRYMTIFLKSSDQCLVFKGIIKSQESKIWTFFLPWNAVLECLNNYILTLIFAPKMILF